MSAFFIGIDGGGSGCRAAVAGPDGVVLGRGTSGAANVLTDIDGGTRHIIEAAGEACREAACGADVLEKSDAVLGLAGANVEATVRAVVERLPFRRCAVESDALIAAHGALGDHNGAVAILGTGSVFASKNDDQIQTVGGWGFVVGDQGSGAVLGRRLMQRALLAHDGVKPGSPATAHILREFGDDPAALVAFAHKAVPGEFARYARLVIDYADRGDAVAGELLVAGARDVDASIAVTLQRTERRLCLLGGLAAAYEPRLSTEHRACLVPALADAVEGASRLAVKRFGAGGGHND
ncbi:MAG: BadF/BadG/BcrA/BcrD ATPase family protein [Pseudomonadota bacterium]